MSRVITAQTPARQGSAAASYPGVRRVALAILVLAGTGLAFQVALTRTFSLMFQYHYVFLVVSLATLGLGVGAALGYMAARDNRHDAGMRFIFPSVVILAVSFPLVAWLMTRIRSPEVTVSVVLVAMAPFLLIGWINALVYARHSAHSNLIYGADLVGAAGGLVLGPGLITLLGPFGTTLALGVLVGAAALLFSARGRQLQVSAVLLILAAAFTAANRGQDIIAYDPGARTDAPPDKTMIHILNDAAQAAKVIATRWSSFAQVDVVETNDDSARFVFTDAGAGSIMLRYDPGADMADYDWLKREVAYIPFGFEPVANTLIIGSGAGYDVMMARVAGADSITAVEINPAIVAVTRDYADYNGDVLDWPNVTTVVTDGRNFVDRSNDRYDLIYLNFVYSQAAHPGVSSLSENYAFTTEALRSYWDRLSDDGQMAFVMHSSVHGLRLMMSALKALEEEGLAIPDALRHMALYYQPNPADPTVTPSVLLIKRRAWTEAEAEQLTDPVKFYGMEPQYIPYVWEDYFAPLADGSISLDGYINAYEDYNIAPTVDNQPFFYHLDLGLPSALRTLLIVSALLASGYFIASAAIQAPNPTHEWTRIDLLAYFALLGGGFMLAEVTLLQYFRLLLGDPIRAFSAALGALLLGGGLGSMFSQRFSLARLPVIIRSAAAGIALWLLIATVAYPAVVTWALPASTAVRTLVTGLALLPLGFLMGIPFPGGLRVAGDQDTSGIPLFWGMNAVASTLGGVLASVLALIMGFQLALVTGALLYLLAAGLVQFTWRRVLRIT